MNKHHIIGNLMHIYIFFDALYAVSALIFHKSSTIEKPSPPKANPSLRYHKKTRNPVNSTSNNQNTLRLINQLAI